MVFKVQRPDAPQNRAGCCSQKRRHKGFRNAVCSDYGHDGVDQCVCTDVLGSGIGIPEKQENAAHDQQGVGQGACQPRCNVDPAQKLSLQQPVNQHEHVVGSNADEDAGQEADNEALNRRQEGRPLQIYGIKRGEHKGSDTALEGVVQKAGQPKHAAQNGAFFRSEKKGADDDGNMHRGCIDGSKGNEPQIGDKCQQCNDGNKKGGQHKVLGFVRRSQKNTAYL